MCKKRSVVTSLLIVIGLSFMAAACNTGVRVGDLQTRSQTVELGDTDSVDVDIQMGAGELEIFGGASDLLEASFTYNVKEMNPQVTYANDRLEVRDSDVRAGIRSLFDLDEFRNEWDLKLNEHVPLEMTIDLGAGRSNLVLGALALTSLTIEGGAGEVVLDLSGSQSLTQLDFELGAGDSTIDLTGEWRDDLDATIVGGLGEINLRLPEDVGVRIRVETGIGGIDATGLIRDGDTYTNAAYETSDVKLRIDLEGGVGHINLDTE